MNDYLIVIDTPYPLYKEFEKLNAVDKLFNARIVTLPDKKSNAVICKKLLETFSTNQMVSVDGFIFQKILIPPEVREEAYKAPNKKRLRNLLNEMQGFFVLCQEDDFLNKEILKTLLDKGEAAAIAQAEFTKSSLILDEKKGREQAEKRELKVFPTLQILCLLKEFGAISGVKPYLDNLIEMKFYLSKKIYNSILKEVGEAE